MSLKESARDSLLTPRFSKSASSVDWHSRRARRAERMASTSWHSLLITVREPDDEHHDVTSKGAHRHKASGCLHSRRDALGKV
jgi:hypothetical protein